MVGGTASFSLRDGLYVSSKKLERNSEEASLFGIHHYSYHWFRRDFLSKQAHEVGTISNLTTTESWLVSQFGFHAVLSSLTLACVLLRAQIGVMIDVRDESPSDWNAY